MFRRLISDRDLLTQVETAELIDQGLPFGRNASRILE
jgi:hypothetical protein